MNPEPGGRTAGRRFFKAAEQVFRSETWRFTLTTGLVRQMVLAEGHFKSVGYLV